MPPDRRDAALLLDMVEHARRAVEYTHDRSLEDYLRTPMLRDAVERVVKVIGEAASKVSEQFRRSYPGIPWRQVIAQRHVLVHEYGRIDDERIWRVATVYVPELLSLIEPLVPQPPPDPLPEGPA